MIELFPFQSIASDSIAERVVAYDRQPITFSSSRGDHRVPFIQLLSSITASGKTIILADAAASIAKELPVSPVILWLSKASVVVEQTYANLDKGGNLHSLMSDFLVRPLADYDQSEVGGTTQPLLFFATIGTFNQQNKEKGQLKVFRSSIDEAAQSTWEALKLRPDVAGNRRPLVVVYDEAHNFSDQQTKLLLELEPNAFVLATATARLPALLNTEVLQHLRGIGKYTDEQLVTRVDAKAVADTDLIKSTVELIGRQAPMEEVVDDLLSALKQTELDGSIHGLAGKPKAVYVCKTNMIEGSSDRDVSKRPFLQRQAPPILIWRHLTEKLSVDPAEIAVYSDLKIDKNYPLPEDFVLFNGGDSNYSDFISGDYRHVIFNQTLQEGWDDPLVYFAYIDKSVGSKIQAEQIVGRLLRQPGRRQYGSDRLNTAQVYVRVESAGVFDDVVTSIQKRIESTEAAIKVVKISSASDARTEYEPRVERFVPQAAIIADEALEPIAAAIDKMADYRFDPGVNVQGVGATARVQKIVGEPGNQSFVWEKIGHSAMVLARWHFAREVRRISPGALEVSVTAGTNGEATKFDAMVGLGSKAAHHISEVAHRVANEFVENVYLELRRRNPHVVSAVRQRSENLDLFKNSVHEGYEGLNPDEAKFAYALDRTGRTWVRNPPKSGYGIPLIEPGKTATFYPDFLVWEDDGPNVFAIDTKGAHLHSDALRKLVNIRTVDKDSPRVFVRFVTPGLVEQDGAMHDDAGFTVWSFKPSGKPEFNHFDSVDEAVARCLKPDKTA